MADFESGLTEPTVEGKVRQLVGLLTNTPFEDVGTDFNWKNILDQDRLDYFNVMAAEALTTYFNVPSEPEDVDGTSTIQDLVNRINNGA
ncbi:unnamed protein product [Caenorhabditis sp. 36 PRJEB53466]|nr:unnamed protein product [Caenorhabditis sp. 36 PRJEB53466]